MSQRLNIALRLVTLVVPGGAASFALAQTSIGEERILGQEVSAEGITFRVRSGGCTAKANFGLETVRQAKPLTVRLLRLRPDYCEARIPEGVPIFFRFAEIGAGPALAPEAQKSLVILNLTP